jgi:predicted permease
MRFLWFIILFYGSLGLGYAFRRYQAATPRIMFLALLCLETPIFFFSFWSLDFAQIAFYAPIPVLAIFAMLLPMLLAVSWAPKLGLDRLGQGSFILASAFSNVGTTGGAFICYLLFGLPGLALAYLFLSPYPLIVFTLGFSIAKNYASDCCLTWRDYVKNILANLISAVPLAGIALGALINLMGVRPISGVTLWIDAIIKIDLALMCFAIGMTLKPAQFFRPWRVVWSVAAIKFLALPIFAFVCALLFYGGLTPLPAKILLIQCAMPPAIYAVITANLYRLDKNIANAIWISNTLLLVPVLVILLLARL